MTADVNFRPLTPEEIGICQANGCAAEDWGQIRVGPGFRVEALREARFSGSIRLGRFDERVTLAGGVSFPTGVDHARLHNCTVGDNALVRNIGSHVANYRIGAGAIIDSVGLLATDGESGFGNGVRVHVANEAGGREIPIFDRLSAPLAYCLAFYQYRPQLLERLRAMIDRYVAGVRSATGSVGPGAILRNCLSVQNVRVGAGAVVEGALRLLDGTIGSSRAAPTLVGEGVNAEHFVIGSGSQVKSGAQITCCFLGQGVKVRQQFSAEHSVFFANAEAYHGEACSVFAGPYTVSHHKSSLLLAAHFSFFNAGSGTNFSNHMYKLGPVHQGLLERGCKTGSFTHLYWPSRLGAFTVAVGRHPRHLDAAAFPFSYLLEDEDGASLLLPAANLFTIGLWRDGRKWPKRDRRADPDRLDPVRTEVFSPYALERMIAAFNRLDDLEAQVPPAQPHVPWGKARIPRERLRKAADLYDLAIRRAVSEILVARLERGGDPAIAFAAPRIDGTGEWTDLGGLLAPARKVRELLDAVERGTVAELAAFEENLARLHDGYDGFAFDFALDTWLDETGLSEGAIRNADLMRLVETWRTDSLRILALLRQDATKEFAEEFRIAYGLDGSAEEAERDFASVRGAERDHPVLRELAEEEAEVGRRAESLLRRLRGETHGV